MKIAPDKIKHFVVGILMGLFLQGAAWWLIPTHIITATVLTFIIIFFISYGFELFSKITGHGHYDVMDAVASILGGIIGMGTILLVQLK
ncbi:MAG TPA: hypothetical protein VEB42_05950 [Chitinophagaceae bacterium]|nr:hypothetical protein [Chitinophagaceae bacterium]